VLFLIEIDYYPLLWQKSIPNMTQTLEYSEKIAWNFEHKMLLAALKYITDVSMFHTLSLQNRKKRAIRQKKKF